MPGVEGGRRNATDEQRSADVQHLVAELFEIAGILRRDGEATARRAGQTQSRWQVMWVAGTGRLTVPMIARRLGVTRQSVQRTADEIVRDELATFEPNPDHRRSPLLVLTEAGAEALRQMNEAGLERNLEHAASLGDDGVARLRELLARYRESLAR
jgi:DNA-binding MarR family transcriptional regulator